MLKNIKMNPNGSLRGPIYAPKPTPKVLDALRRLINLLTEAGFTDGSFNAQTLLECNHDIVTAAGQSLFKTLSTLIGTHDPEDNPTPPIRLTGQRITSRFTMDKILTPINDSLKNEHTGLSRYASA